MDHPLLDFNGDASRVSLFAECLRLTHGYQYNPAFASEVSRIDPLPHQRIAVYDHMLHQDPLRFLLADDAGAGGPDAAMNPTPWHQIVLLKPELRSGELSLAEFAADLHEVVTRAGRRPIYEDPAKPHVIGIVKGIAKLDETTGRARKEAEKRFLDSFPFHPDLTDVFYSRWTQIEGFQRTRGILRTLATALRDAEPWDRSPIVGPAVPLSGPRSGAGGRGSLPPFAARRLQGAQARTAAPRRRLRADAIELERRACAAGGTRPGSWTTTTSETIPLSSEASSRCRDPGAWATPPTSSRCTTRPVATA